MTYRRWDSSHYLLLNNNEYQTKKIFLDQIRKHIYAYLPKTLHSIEISDWIEGVIWIQCPSQSILSLVSFEKNQLLTILKNFPFESDRSTFPIKDITLSLNKK